MINNKSNEILLYTFSGKLMFFGMFVAERLKAEDKIHWFRYHSLSSALGVIGVYVDKDL